MQDFDVYRPPGAPDDPGLGAARGRAGAPQPWDPVLVLQAAWDVVKVHWPVLVFAPFIAGLIQTGPSLVLNQINLGGLGVTLGVRLAGTLFQWVLGAFFAGGMAQLLLVGARRTEPVFGAIFEGGRWFGTMLGMDALVGIARSLLMGVCFAPAGVIAMRDLGLDKSFTMDPNALLRRMSHLSPDFWVASLAGVGVLCVLAVFVLIRIEFAHYYVVDAGHGAIEALGASWQATRGQVLKLLGFWVLSGLLFFAAFAACCLPAMLAGAVVRVAEAMIYLAISGRGSVEPSATG